MTETLLSPSNVLLFGRLVADIVVKPPVKIRRNFITVSGHSKKVIDTDVALTEVVNKPGFYEFETYKLEVNDLVFLQSTKNKKMGVYYIVQELDNNIINAYLRLKSPLPSQKELFIKSALNGKNIYFSVDKDGSVKNRTADEFERIDYRHSPFRKNRKGRPSDIEQQLHAKSDPKFARIYGFSFEGVYYDLARPVLFLVHGDGYPASERFGNGPNRARAPGDPSLIGTGTTDFQYAEDIMVWSYDQADYTIRMDVQSGMFEQVLLDAVLGGNPSADVSGMNARGMNARGMSARGMNARGMNARGGNSD